MTLATKKSAENVFETLLAKFQDRTAVAGVIGLGYVGLPQVCGLSSCGFKTIGFDIDESKIKNLFDGVSYVGNIYGEEIFTHVRSGQCLPTTDFSKLAQADAIIICVPTPLDKNNDPDLSYVEKTTETIAKHLRPGQLIVLESTTYPGTTTEIVKPILEKTGLKSGVDFFLAFAPERVEPGNMKFPAHQIPKVVGGDGEEALKLAVALYDQFILRTVPVSSPATAEAAKLTENIFRAVNIALVNELKVIYDKMGIDIWEVIQAASTKPFGYMPFYPGPGLGGHCIPIDPFYLTWKARQAGVETQFIELAGKINVAMPHYVLEKTQAALGRPLKGAKILVLGVAYKKDVADVRESPAFAIMEILKACGAVFDFYDPQVPEIPNLREHPEFVGLKSVEWNPEGFKTYDAAIIVTDHSAVDYRALAQNSRLVVDTRNVMREIPTKTPVIRA